MIFNYYDNKQIKKENGTIQYFKQIKPFADGTIWNGLVSAMPYGSSVFYFSKKTKICLGTSHITTVKNLFKAV